MGDFKNVFKRLRTSSGLTQAEMAEKLGIAKSTISMYENGNREPDFETLEQIADFFNIDMDYLLGRTDKTTLCPETIGSYYMNEDAREMAQFMYENPEYKVLFDASRKVSKADIETVKMIMDKFRSNDN